MFVLLVRACLKAPGMHMRCLQTSLNRKGSTKILLWTAKEKRIYMVFSGPKMETFLKIHYIANLLDQGLLYRGLTVVNWLDELVGWLEANRNIFNEHVILPKACQRILAKMDVLADKWLALKSHNITATDPMLISEISQGCNRKNEWSGTPTIPAEVWATWETKPCFARG